MNNNDNKVCNPKVEVPTGMNMNDKDYLDSLLSSEKCLLKNYAVALTEASNEFLHDNYLNMFDEIDDLQRRLFNAAFKRGWYVLEKAESTKVSEKLQMLEQEQRDLNG